jgi:hypothetical protein
MHRIATLSRRFSRRTSIIRRKHREAGPMDTLHRELEQLVAEVAPPLIDAVWMEDAAQLERLVTEDELRVFDDECFAHDGCRPVLDRRIA